MEDKGFIETLFDMSFTEFITTKIIKFLFVLGILFVRRWYKGKTVWTVPPAAN